MSHSSRNAVRRWALLFAAALASASFASPGDPQRTAPLLEVLQSSTNLHDRVRACQQAGEFGTPEMIPALAALLNDPQLAGCARSGLENIPDPAAAAALRSALSATQGNLRAGVVVSLGRLRDRQSVKALTALAADPSCGVAKEALLALGRIADRDSVAALRAALRSGPAELRADAGSACLLAAEQLSKDKETRTARKLYDEVRAAAVPDVVRCGAVRGAILTRPGDSGFLAEQLKSADRAVREAALFAARECPGDVVVKAIAPILPRAAADVQVLLLQALADSRSPKSLPPLRSCLGSDSAPVRLAALAGLCAVNDAAVMSPLLEVLQNPRSPQEASAALNGLVRLEGPDIDPALMKALTGAKEPGLRARLCQVIGMRGAPGAVDELLRQAADPDAGVRLAALRAVKPLARAGDVGVLLERMRSGGEDEARQAAEAAILTACEADGAAAEAVLGALKSAGQPADRMSCIRILAAHGYKPALPAITGALQDGDAAVADCAASQLGRWPDPEPVEPLLAVIESSADAGRRRKAFDAAVQRVATAAEKRQRPPEVLVKWFRRAHAAAGTADEKRRLVSGLARFPNIEGFRLLVADFDDAAVRAEAGLALTQTAGAVADAGHAEEARAVLERVLAAADSDALRGKAREALAKLPAVERFGLLPGGWEGNTNVWRIRDGVIVGGTMAGNPRNEFLATVSSYTNFTLRLEYKLVGTAGFVNGGVQLRSVRTKQPPNEMSGYQADIGAGYSGCLYDESRRNRVLSRPPAEQVKRLEKPGDWNRLEVRCEGPRIRITLNGEQTVDFQETDPAMAPEGKVGLQIHGGNNAEISFRNIQLEELPSSPPAK